MKAAAAALFDDGDLASARPLFEAAYTAAERAGDAPAMAEAVLGLAGLWVHEHRTAQGAATVDERLRHVLALLERSAATEAPVLRLRLRARIAAEEDYRGGDHARILAVLDEARAAGDPVAHAEALSLAHHCLLGPAEAAQRRAVAAELMAVGPRTGRRADALMGTFWHTADLFLDGDRHAGRRLDELSELLAERDFLAVGYVASAIKVMLSIRAGRLDHAEWLAGACAERGREAGDADAVGWFGGQLFAIRWFQSRVTELLPMYDEMAHSSTLSAPDSSLLSAVAVAAAFAGDRARAASALAAVRGDGLAGLPRSSTWLVTLYGVVEAAHVTGDAELSAEAYDLLRPYARRPMTASLGIACFGVVEHALGVAALTGGRLDPAVDHFRAARRDNLALGHRPAALHSRVRLAEALTRRGGPGDAAAAARETAEAAVEAAELDLPLPGGVLDVVLGRDAERAQLRGMAWEVRNGRGRGVVVRGAPGIGKTTLLDDLAAAAHGFRIVRTAGVEFEADLPFAALTALTRPLLGYLDQVPAGQAEAFRSATALAVPDRPAERVAVYAATLSLLAAAAEDVPLLCVIDDAHWLDRASAEALLFTARRLLAERILLVFAARTDPGFAAPGPGFAAPGLAEVPLDGLDRAAGAALLRRCGVGSGPVAEHLVTLTEGNPLALREVAVALSDEQKAGQVPLAEPLPATDRIERAFADRVSTLGADEQRALLVCAAAGTGTPAMIARALAVLGFDLAALDPATRLGLLDASADAVRFRHPLIRSAVYHRAGPGDRRAAHAALAEACAADDDADRRAWHLSLAATGPDAAVAAVLDETAVRARQRGGLVAEASALERAAALTPEPAQRGARLARAAGVWVSVGAVEHGSELLELAVPLAETPGERLRVMTQRGYLALLRGEHRTAFEPIVAEAERHADAAPREAGLALSMAMNGPLSRWDVEGVLRVCLRAAELVGSAVPDPQTPKIAVRLAQALVLAGRPEGHPLALRCAPVCDSREAHGARAELGDLLTWIEEYDLARRMFDGDVDGARRVGDVSLLAYALPLRARLDLRTGRLAQAYCDALEGVELAEAMGQPGNTAEALAVLAQVEAALGRSADCATHAAAATALAPHNLGVETQARSALGLAALAAGRHDDAVLELRRAHDLLLAGGVAEPGVVPVAADLAEALVRSGRPDEGTTVLAGLGEHRQRAGAARVRALLADADDAYLAALAVPAASPLDRARTLLAYGQWLRRARRRGPARQQLTAALELFEAAGAATFAEQARAELAASAGGRPEPVAGSVTDQLTAHEWRIAYAAAQGDTSREIADRMLLSIRTVDYHLGNVYRKLGIRSRRDLIQLIGH